MLCDQSYGDDGYRGLDNSSRDTEDERVCRFRDEFRNYLIPDHYRHPSIHPQQPTRVFIVRRSHYPCRNKTGGGVAETPKRDHIRSNTSHNTRTKREQGSDELCVSTLVYCMEVCRFYSTY